MKQWRWIFLVWILLLFPVCAFGAQGEIPSQMTSTEVCDYIDAHPTQCGGYYFDGFQKELHVVPLLDDSTSLFSFSETTDGYDLVYDAPAVYSKQDLDDAFYYLRQHRDEWDLVSYAVRTKDNGLCISAMEWTDEKKESLKEATGIDQIEFLTATEFSGEGTRQEEMKMEALRVLSLLALYQEELGIADAYFYQEVGNPVSKEIVILAEDWDEEQQEMLEKLTDREDLQVHALDYAPNGGREGEEKRIETETLRQMGNTVLFLLTMS